MYKRLLHLLAILATLIIISSGYPTDKIKACGHYLADVLALVCQGKYNDLFSTMVDIDSTTSAPHRRVARGVADECCKLGCTWNTLEQYCAYSPGGSDSISSRFAREDLTYNHIEPHVVDQSTPVNRNRSNRIPGKQKGKGKKKRRRRKCRCRRHKKRKFDMNKIDNMLKDQPPIEIGTVPSLNLGKPVFVPRVKRVAHIESHSPP